MTQSLLAHQLQQKLGYSQRFVKSELRTVHGGVAKRRTSSKASINLAPPDLLMQVPHLLRFNLKDKTVHKEQAQKVQEETGLNWHLQRDLAECRLDSEVAKLIFYSYRMAVLTKRENTVALVCDYVALAKAALVKPASNAAEFWTEGRKRYRTTVASYRNAMERQKTLAPDDANRNCIDDFLGHLTAWGI